MGFEGFDEAHLKKERLCRDIVRMMFDAMDDKKKYAYEEACARVSYLTSHYGMSRYTLSTYKEGWYFETEGCRTQYKAWAFDNDGEMIIGRKPKEDKLHFIWHYTFIDNPIDLKTLQK